LNELVALKSVGADIDMVRHQVLPDRLAIAAKREALFDPFSVCSQVLRMDGVGEKGAIKSRVTSLAGFCRTVEGHFVGRFCRDSLSPKTRQPYNDARGFQVGAGCFSLGRSMYSAAPNRSSVSCSGHQVLQSAELVSCAGEGKQPLHLVDWTSMLRQRVLSAFSSPLILK
jgi:hypothetical protein